MAGVLTSAKRTLPGTALEFEMVYAPNPEHLSRCSICNSLADGARFKTFVDGAAQSDICIPCSFDIYALVRGNPDRDLRIAASTHHPDEPRVSQRNERH
jgi:hypothetical protein